MLYSGRDKKQNILFYFSFTKAGINDYIGFSFEELRLQSSWSFRYSCFLYKCYFQLPRLALLMLKVETIVFFISVFILFTNRNSFVVLEEERSRSGDFFLQQNQYVIPETKHFPTKLMATICSKSVTEAGLINLIRGCNFFPLNSMDSFSLRRFFNVWVHLVRKEQ